MIKSMRCFLAFLQASSFHACAWSLNEGQHRVSLGPPRQDRPHPDLREVVSLTDSRWEGSGPLNETLSTLFKKIEFPGKVAPGAKIGEGGNSKSFVNCAVVAILATVCAATYLGHLADGSSEPKDRPRGAVIGMLCVSYALLIPGLLCVLFSFRLIVGMFGVRAMVSRNLAHEPASLSPSVISLVRLLLQGDAYVGAFLLVLFAMVVPLVKLVLIFMAEGLRHSESTGRVRIARWSIHIVSSVSKWACPDMFAYILMLCMFRSVDDPRPPSIDSKGHLDVAFTCFATFCVCSTLSTLFIPQVSEKGTLHRGGPEKRRSASLGPLVVFATIVLTLAFTWFFVNGLRKPCIGMRLDATSLLESLKVEEGVPAVMRPIFGAKLKSLVAKEITEQIGPKVNTELSLFMCIGNLLYWVVDEGELSCFMAVVMLCVFAVAITGLDMLALLAAAWSLCVSEGKAADDRKAPAAMRVSSVLKHVSMLDVFVMGVFVVVWAGGAYGNKGVFLELRPGFFALAGAEAVHYSTYWLVSWAFGSPHSEDEPEEKA